MFDNLTATTATTSLSALVKGIRGRRRYDAYPNFVVSLHDQKDQDLPCPWCYSPTDEFDTRCSGCGRKFG